MSGTKEGGLKVKAMNLANHGPGYYARIGSKGGSKLGVKKGFALQSREMVAYYGSIGGSISKRTKAKK